MRAFHQGMEVSMAVAITRTDFSEREIRVAAAAQDAKAARRLLAIALVSERVVQEGVVRKTAGDSCGMDRQTLRGEEDRKTVQ
jgi:hypothetical protein